MTGAREAALHTLIRCRRDGAWSGAIIDNAIKKYGLDRREAALASRICLGVLQNTALCDFYIDSFCGGRLEPKLRDILRIGVYQLVFLDRIPARAAVSETVSLCKAQGYSRAAGLANAVLRKIAEAGENLPPIPNEGTVSHLALKYSHPQWLVEYLIKRKGYAFTESFLACNNRLPGLSLQVNTLRLCSDAYSAELCKAGIEHRSYPEPDGCIVIKGGSTTELPGFDEGLFYIQDRAARIAVEVAAPECGMRVLDACAAPGGKSFAAALAMKNKGFITSCDIHEKKLALINEGAKRLGISIISTKAKDASLYDEEFSENFDVVIADVPCSGMGVIAKKPEIRNKSPESIERLPEIQLNILRNLARYVKKGGTLLYSTCTVMQEENEAVVRAFLAENDGFCLEPFNLCGVDARDGMHEFWPNVEGTDGFFVAKLRKK